MPASLASSTTYWIRGISTMVSISFGIALVAGRKRVPRPATGKTALRMAFMEPAGMEPWRVYTGCVNNRETLSGALSRANDERGLSRSMPIARHLIWLAPLLVAGGALAQDDRYPQS